MYKEEYFYDLVIYSLALPDDSDRVGTVDFDGFQVILDEEKQQLRINLSGAQFNQLKELMSV